VCPWNRKAPITLGNPDLAPRGELINPDLAWLADLENADFERLFNGSPIRRAGFLGLRRNIAIAMGNSHLTRWAPWLTRWALLEAEPNRSPETGDGPGRNPVPDSTQAAVRDAASWALHRLTAIEKAESAGS